MIKKHFEERSKPVHALVIHTQVFPSWNLGLGKQPRTTLRGDNLENVVALTAKTVPAE